MNRLTVYLASASPRRRDLLRGIGVDPVVLPQDLDERPRPDEPPRELALRLARAKGARATAAIASASEPGLVIAADTVVTIDDETLGKPQDSLDAARMLRQLRGRSHEVLTAVFLQRTDDGRHVQDVDATRVTFRDFDDRTVDDYVACGEPSGKAGAYGIQGRGVLLTERVEGSWSNVVGLPLERLPAWLRSLDLDVWSLLR